MNHVEDVQPAPSGIDLPRSRPCLDYPVEPVSFLAPNGEE